MTKEIGGVEKALPRNGQSKIDVSPTKKAADGMCTCPICGHRHPLGQPHGAIPGQ